MIVVDTNVIAYLLLPGERSASARAVLRRNAEWASPLLWRSEFRSVLAQYLRSAALDFESATRLMDEAETLLRGGEFQVPSAEVLRLVSTSKCSAYDCEFVALAEDLAVPLVTADSRVLNEFPSVTTSLEEFARG